MRAAFQPTIAESERFWKRECPDARYIGNDCMESPCVMHGGDNPRALAIDNRKGAAHCHTRCQRGWGVLQWVKERYGLDDAEAWEHINEILGRPTAPAWPLAVPAPREITTEPWRLRQLARLIEDGREWLRQKARSGNWIPRGLYVYGQRVKARYDNADKPGDKQMLWFEVGPRKGWLRKLDRTALTPLYHQDKVRAAAQAGQAVVLANGEKARDRVIAAGWPVAVTCLPNGEKSWNDQYAAVFQGAEVVYVVCDNDPVGDLCGRRNAGALMAAGVPARVVKLPNLPPSGDLWDWENQGRNFEEFLSVAQNSPPGDPADAKLRAKAEKNGQPPKPPAPPAPLQPDEPDLIRYA